MEARLVWAVVGVPVFVMWLLLDMTTNERLTSNLGSELAKTLYSLEESRGSRCGSSPQ